MENIPCNLQFLSMKLNVTLNVVILKNDVIKLKQMNYKYKAISLKAYKQYNKNKDKQLSCKFKKTVHL